MEKKHSSDSEQEINEAEYKYYKGRIKRSQEYKKLRQMVISSLNTTTVVIFLIWFYENLQEHLEVERTRIPGYQFLIITAIRFYVLGGLCNGLFALLD